MKCHRRRQEVLRGVLEARAWEAGTGLEIYTMDIRQLLAGMFDRYLWMMGKLAEFMKVIKSGIHIAIGLFFN